MLAMVAAVVQHTEFCEVSKFRINAYSAMRPIAVTAAITRLTIWAFGLIGILSDRYRDRCFRGLRIDRRTLGHAEIV